MSARRSGANEGHDGPPTRDRAGSTADPRPAALFEESDERIDPVAGRSTGGGERRRPGRVPAAIAARSRSAARGERGPDLRAGGIDRAAPAGLRVDQGQEAGIGQADLTTVDELDRDDVVTLGEASQGPLPGGRADEVADDDGQSPPPGEDARAGRSPARGRRCRRSGRAAQLEQDRGQVGPAGPDGHDDRTVAGQELDPEVDRGRGSPACPAPPGRPGPGRACASAAVPKSRLPLRSTRTTTSSSRSATASRTWAHLGPRGDRPVDPADVVARDCRDGRRRPRSRDRPGVRDGRPRAHHGPVGRRPARRDGASPAVGSGAWLRPSRRTQAEGAATQTGGSGCEAAPGRAGSGRPGSRVGAVQASRDDRGPDLRQQGARARRRRSCRRPAPGRTGRVAGSARRRRRHRRPGGRPVAAPKQGQGLGGTDQAEARPGARAVLEQAGQLGQAVSGRDRAWPGPGGSRSSSWRRPSRRPGPPPGGRRLPRDRAGG